MGNSEKKIIQLNGGLGNQMFQYAFGYVLVKKFGFDVVFDYAFFEEIKKYDETTTREFELGVFNLECPEATQEDLDKIIYSPRTSKIKKFLWEILRIKKYKPEGNTCLQTKPYFFDKSLFRNTSYYCYNGYFQNEKYFKFFREDILNIFSLKEPLDEKNQSVLDVIKSTNSVSVHVRRGDYVTLESASKFHGLCPIEYYEKAINYIAKQVKNPHFFLFSDDIGWVAKNLKINHSYTVIDFNQGKGYADLELMKNCKHNIIANSSFSWWGAWLNENPQKIVVAPEKWTAQKVEKCDIIPRRWKKF